MVWCSMISDMRLEIGGISYTMLRSMDGIWEQKLGRAT